MSFCVFSYRSLSFFCFRHRVSGKHEARLTLSLILPPRSGASVSQARYRYTTFGMASNSRLIGFKSITENIDTTTSGGKLVFHLFGALAEFERDIIRERTLAGLEAARARGHHGGRPKIGETQKKIMARKLYADKSNKVNDICKTLRISRATLYRYVKKDTAKNT